MIFYINLHAIMKNLLKYLVLFLMAAAFSNVADRFDSSSESTHGSVLPVEVMTASGSFSAASADMLSAPRTLSLSGTSRVLSTARRTINAHSRSLSGFIKSGKSINVSVFFSFYRNSTTINTSVIGHAHKLVVLGKLLI